MNKFIQELQDRGVIRVAGLYGAIVWLLLQASDVLLPAFNIPDSSVKIILYGSIICFPVVVSLAWFYEITDKGIQLEEDVRRTGAKRLGTGNEIYFIIIAILGIALSISVWMNFQSNDGTDTEPQEFVSVLIADFDNQTNDPLFDGSVEEALSIGIEGASFITAYNRTKALSIANQLNSGEKLGDERARLVAVREGIDLILSGTIAFDEDEYLMTLNAIDPKAGDIIAEADASATGKLEVLQAVGSLASQLRGELGDASIVQGDTFSSETFSAGSLKAMQLYAEAQSKAQNGNNEAAVLLYEQATQEDKKFGRAYSGWALSEFQLGRREKANELWEKTMTLLDGMGKREKYRTLGLYYTVVTSNYQKAIENYELLVKDYPADAVGHSNLAVNYFFNRQFDKALEGGKGVLDLYPNNAVIHSNYSLYAMYAGDFSTAKAESLKLQANDSSFPLLYLPLAMSNLAEGNYTAAISDYQAMSALGENAASMAAMGLADLEMLRGENAAAVEILKSGIEADAVAGITSGQADKYIGLAHAYLDLEDQSAATQALASALQLSNSLSHRVPAARLYILLGDLDAARAIEKGLAGDLQVESRAAAALIKGNSLLAEEKYVEAVDALQASIKFADTWLARFDLGRTYFAAGYFAEALSEFEACQQRIGETTALFLDDKPTFHHSAQAKDWLTKTKQKLGMSAE